MRVFSFALFLLLTLTARTDDFSDAKEILDRYLKTPRPVLPKTDTYDPTVDKQENEARQARLSILAELRAMPKGAVSAAERVLFEQASPKQRDEIVGALGDNIHTRECAELLHRVLQDVRESEGMAEELVRCSAVHGLRMMARCTDRNGGKRIQLKPDFQPQVTGLVPYLISAANDKSEEVRISALYALADSRDPVAQIALRKALQDSSRRVRLHAACFLTEFQDASGLAEMRQAIDYVRKTHYYCEDEMLLASFERITGKSFGEIPLNPLLCGSDQGEAQRYEELLDTWHAWWIWQPTGQEKKNP